MTFSELVYSATETFPRREWFGLVAQVRRSSVSVASNIAEGHGRITRGEWQQFLGHARGSLLEAHTQLLLSLRLRFGNEEELKSIISLAEELGRVINGLIDSTFRRLPRKPPRN